MPIKFTNATPVGPNAVPDSGSADAVLKAGLSGAFDPRWDRLAELLVWEANFKADSRYAELEALKKAGIEHWNQTQGRDKSGHLQTSDGQIEFKMGNARAGSTNARAVHKAVGDDVFYSIAKVNAGDVKQYVPAHLQAGLIGPGTRDNPSIKGYIPGLKSEEVF